MQQQEQWRNHISNPKQRKSELGVACGFETSKLTFGDLLPPARPDLLNLFRHMFKMPELWETLLILTVIGAPRTKEEKKGYQSLGLAHVLEGCPIPQHICCSCLSFPLEF